MFQPYVKMIQPVIANQLPSSNPWLKILFPYIATCFFVSNPYRFLPNPTLLPDFLSPTLRLKSSWHVIANVSFDSDMCGLQFRTRHCCLIVHPPILQLKNSWYVIANVSFVSDQCGRMSPNSLFQTNFSSFNLAIEGSRPLLLTIYWYRPNDWCVSGVLLLTPVRFPIHAENFVNDYC